MRRAALVSWLAKVKVADFGLARLRLTSAVKASGFLKGKPAYMSPEQISLTMKLDGRSDLWAVGVMLWELLTNSSLFERHLSAAPTAFEDGLRDVLYAVCHEPIPSPSEVNLDVPADLSRVTMKLLERHPC